MSTRTHRIRRGPALAAGRTTEPDGRRALGHRGEELGAAYLRRLGFTLLASNVRSARGEIDLIVFDGRTLVFTEVKCRRARSAGKDASGDAPRPLAGLRPGQRARVRRLARAWLADRARSRPYAQEIRFDAIGVTVDASNRLVELEHLQGAW